MFTHRVASTGLHPHSCIHKVASTGLNPFRLPHGSIFDFLKIWYKLFHLVSCISSFPCQYFITMSSKCAYLFVHTSIWNSRIKSVLAVVIEGWVTYWEVFRDIAWVRPKHGKYLCGDYSVSKQDYRASEKLTHRPSHGWSPPAERAGVRGSLAVVGWGV